MSTKLIYISLVVDLAFHSLTAQQWCGDLGAFMVQKGPPSIVSFYYIQLHIRIMFLIQWCQDMPVFMNFQDFQICQLLLANRFKDNPC